MDTKDLEGPSDKMSKRINLVVQSYGRESEYLRAIFAIWSYYAHVSDEFKQCRALVYTDNTDFFKGYFEGLNVQFIALTPSRMKAMKGKHDFLHRMKISIIEETFKRFDGDVFYFDSDTFFVADPSVFILRVSEKASFMHSNEYSFHELRDIPLPSGAPFHAVLKYLEEWEFRGADGNVLSLPSNLFSWNAGALLLHQMHQFLLPEVYAITDQLYAATRNHASEQYAFSIVLQTKTELKGCKTVIYHYWYRITKRIMDEFLSFQINGRWRAYSYAQKEAMVLQWTKMLPGFVENHPLTLGDHAIQSFNRDEFYSGYFWAIKSLAKKPFSSSFIRDIAYHTRRLFFRQIGKAYPRCNE